MNQISADYTPRTLTHFDTVVVMPKTRGSQKHLHLAEIQRNHAVVISANWGRGGNHENL